MLTAFQIGLSCRSQLFLFLSEPEFRAFIRHYRERECVRLESLERGRCNFAWLKLFLRTHYSWKKINRPNFKGYQELKRYIKMFVRSINWRNPIHLFLIFKLTYAHMYLKSLRFDHMHKHSVQPPDMVTRFNTAHPELCVLWGLIRID